ncbi:MAG: SDR family oxidoreductase [Oscillospiraceae bacterium]|nr:SDR family oxidoreductase [Oscillospiraceae bacterium]
MAGSIASMNGAFSLAGKNAIITGGNRGLGFGIAKAYAESGANVAILCRDVKKAAESIAELNQFGGKYESFNCDVTDRASVKNAVAAVYDSFGNIDILVNDAGVTAISDLLDMDENLSEWYRCINCDLNGTVHMTYEVAKRMRDAGKGGAIVNITSNAGLMVNFSQAMSGYSCAKAAANHFTHCMACELAKYDIRVNAIAPGFTNSELSEFIPKDMVKYVNDRAVTQRFGEPIEIGALAVYLASPASTQMTGTINVIDGGYMLRC